MFTKEQIDIDFYHYADKQKKKNNYNAFDHL